MSDSERFSRPAAKLAGGREEKRLARARDRIPPHGGHGRGHSPPAGTEALRPSDTVLLRTLLGLAIPEDRAAGIADALIDRFGGFRGALRAGPASLLTAMRGEMNAVILLKSVADAADRLARAEMIEGPVLSSSSKLVGYLRATMSHFRVEHFRVIYMDPRNAIIADEELQRGTVDRVHVYPREIMKRALELEATALLLVHNHPSGDPTPSRVDIRMTKDIQDAAITLGIALQDHIIVARGGHSSFKAMGLL